MKNQKAARVASSRSQNTRFWEGSLREETSPGYDVTESTFLSSRFLEVNLSLRPGGQLQSWKTSSYHLWVGNTKTDSSAASVKRMDEVHLQNRLREEREFRRCLVGWNGYHSLGGT